MKKISLFFLSVLFFFIAFQNSFAQNGDLTLPGLLGTSRILIIGESYGQIESTDFFSKIVMDYVNTGACVKVGLEIPSDQQETLDRAMKGEISMSDVEFDNVIDHDGYREMLVNFSELIISGKCLSVHAIDPPSSTPVNKDSWMEQRVVKMIDDKPIVLLVGNKHAVKDFNIPADSDTKLLAQRLRLRSIDVTSVLQHWKTGYCTTKNVRYYDTETEKKSTIYVKQAIGEISAEMPEEVSSVSDGVMVWSCEREKLAVVDTDNKNVTDRKLIVEISKYEVVDRDQQVLKNIKWGIKHQYPVVGMNQDEATQALGDPYELEKAGNFEKWTYQCSDEDGFNYDCFILRFREGMLVNFDDFV